MTVYFLILWEYYNYGGDFMSNTSLHEIEQLYRRLNISPTGTLQSQSIKSTLDLATPSDHTFYKFSMSNNTSRSKIINKEHTT
jgi:hypothetical protein